ncbi:MAG: penicillin-binding protein 2, partial [Deltaproteobacteria bacterium]
MKWDRYSAESLERKFFPFALVVVLIFSVLFIRLWQLQILKGKEYKDLSENNRIRLRKVLPLRGRILDRKGRVLATNRPSFSVTVIPEDVLDIRKLSKRLSSLLGMDAKAISQKITANGRSPFQPVYIKRDISWEELSRVKALLMDMPGVQVVVEPIRTYPYGELAAHLLGYVGEVDRKELAANDGYDVGDVVGKTGVEAVWEKYLRGSKGGRQVEVDAFGREVRVLGEVLPIPGWDLYLTIDVELQRKAEELLRDKVGAIVALDPSSGEILALCSSPSYSPSLFARGISRGRWKRLRDHPLHPLTNRAIQGLYAPGSVFKIVTAAAALQEGRLSPKE